DIIELNAGSVALDANLDIEIDHPLDRHQNLHRSSIASISGFFSLGAEPKAPAMRGQRANLALLPGLTRQSVPFDRVIPGRSPSWRANPESNTMHCSGFRVRS